MAERKQRVRPSRNNTLVIRPEPLPDESFIGYLIRLTERNRYDTVGRIVDMTGLRGATLREVTFSCSDPGVLRRVAAVVGQDPVRLSPLLHGIVDASSWRCRYEVCGSLVSATIVRATNPAVCVGCLREAAYARKIWDVATVTSCLAHKCLLLVECPGCRKPLTWRRQKVCVCRCGHDWRDADLTPVKEAELIVSRQVHKLCGDPSDRVAAPELGSENPLAALDLHSLSIVLSFIAGQMNGISDVTGSLFRMFSQSTDQHRELHALLCRACSVFECWPHNLYEFFDWRREQGGASSKRTGVQKEFGRFYEDLFRYRSLNGFGLLWKAFNDYRIERWDGGYIQNRSLRLMGDGKQKKRFLSRNETGAQLNMATKWVDNFIAAGKLDAVSRDGGRSRGKLVLIERSSVEKLKAELDQQLGPLEAGRLLGTTLNSVRDLVEHGCLDLSRGPTVDGYGVPRLSRQEIEKLLGRIEAKVNARGGARRGERIGFRSAVVRMGQVGYSFGRFVQAVLDGEIVPRAVDASQTGLRRFQFDHDDLAELAKRCSEADRGEQLYLGEAAKIAKVDFITFSLLVKNGTLTSRKIKREAGLQNGIIITKEELEAFNESFVRAVDLAREHRTSTEIVVQALGKRGVRPVTGPMVDGTPQYLFGRTDVASVEGELATLVSAEKLNGKCQHRLNAAYVADLLGTDVAAVLKLVESGLLLPMKSKTRTGGDDEVLFTMHGVRRYHRLLAGRTDLVSAAAAAAMLNEKPASFYSKWVLRKRLLPVEIEDNPKYVYFYRADVEDLKRIKETTVSGGEAARLLGVTKVQLCRLRESGKIEPVSIRGVVSCRFSLYRRSDIESLLATH